MFLQQWAVVDPISRQQTMSVLMIYLGEIVIISLATIFRSLHAKWQNHQGFNVLCVLCVPE